MRVSLANTTRTFSAAPDRTVLDGALAAGINLPHSCKTGSCGACRARLLHGKVAYPHGRPLGLSDAETEEGYILMCQAQPLSDLHIETFEIGSAGTAVIKRLPCRIERSTFLAHDVLGLELRLPPAEPFAFQPGQYIDVMLSEGRRRSFSIASPPHDSRTLQLHVRLVPGGEFTEPLFAGMREGALLSIEGPLGHFVYRQGTAPLLLVGGGTGLAPLCSILRHVIDLGLRREATLYWGVRTQRDLYADAELRWLMQRSGRFQYHPVVSDPGPDWTGMRGFVHEAVLRDAVPLDAPDIYAAGPPAMIAALRREFVARGADPARLFYDSFDYAPEAIRRQRTSSTTKS